MLEPAVFQNGVVVAGLFSKARPHADHGLNAHVVQLFVHRSRISETFGNKVHLAHLRVIEPVEDKHIKREMALAISFGDVEHLLLREIALLTLYKSVGGFRQHGSCAGKQAIAGIDLVVVLSGDHEE